MFPLNVYRDYPLRVAGGWLTMMRRAVLPVCLCLTMQAAAADCEDPDASAGVSLTCGEALRNQGNLSGAQLQFERGLQWAGAHPDAAGQELIWSLQAASGYNLFLLNKKEAAKTQLLETWNQAPQDHHYLRALLGSYLSSLARADGEAEQAQAYVSQALEAAKAANAGNLILSLELSRLQGSDADADAKIKPLLDIDQRIDAAPADYAKASLALTAAHLGLKLLADGDASRNPELTREIYQAANFVVNLSDEEHAQFKAEALGIEAELYQSQGRFAEALSLAQQALGLLPQTSPSIVQLKLQALTGDLQFKQGDTAGALRNYQMAVKDLNSVRSDLPVYFVNGDSAIETVVDPIYRNYVKLLLNTAGDASQNGQIDLSAALDNMEVIKQTDMQDFFFDRCVTSTALVKDDLRGHDLRDAAIVYPILLKDRLEVIVKTNQGYSRHTVKVDVDEFKKQMNLLIYTLQKPWDSSIDFSVPGKFLYSWLIDPIKPALNEAKVNSLLFVPDRGMRLLPLAALYNGERYVAQDYAVITLPGLELNDINSRKSEPKSNEKQLLAGLETPNGPSLEKLPQKMVMDIEGANNYIAPDTDKGKEMLAEKLKLKGVNKEMEQISQQRNSTVLFDNQFTSSAFKDSLTSGQYNRIHVASHGYFGSSARDSFILAYDDVLYLQDLQKNLQSDEIKQHPVDLLSLSACQTAQGNDKLLLGFSGMAIKSNVKSALGSLWSINNKGTIQFMKLFYSNLNTGVSKAKALQLAQEDMINSNTKDKFWHPYFWAPFILTGDWE